ncbi:MAG: type II toxin-antitoxin system Phd/YefM family antitoxin [Eubacteriales bacterium]
MINMTNAIKNTISISLFNRGLAGKIFEEVKITGAKVVMKNNSAECVLLSPDEYLKLMDEVNDARLLNLAMQRMLNYDSNTAISGREVFHNLGISDTDLSSCDEVEFE